MESPALVTAFGSAQWPGGNQASTVPAVTGKIGAWVAPSSSRTLTSATIAPVAVAAIREGAKPVSQVRKPQAMVRKPSARRVP